MRTTSVITTFLLLVCILPVVLSKYDNVKNIIVIVMENWSYDALFGTIDKANGLANAQKNPILQVDRNDKPYEVLPQVQPQVPKDLPNKPYDLGPYIGMYNETVDLTHAFYMEQMQINKGKMNKFVAYGSAQGLTVSYYDYKDRYLAQLAQNYTMFDAWHHSLFGGSFGNHQWLITPTTPVFPNAPAEIVNILDKDGNLANPEDEREVTPDGYAVNTIYSVSQPRPSWANVSHLLPLQNHTTIGDLLTEAQISWKWYSGGYNDAMAGKADKSFQFHHQPFIYFENYEVGKPGRAHLQDYDDLIFDLKNNSLPQVSFYKPLGKYNMHPGYSIVGGEAEQKLEFVINAIQNSSYWDNTVVFITFDEHGGRWDHVAPPVIDRWGPGSRIPTVMVSPLVKKGFVDSTYRESTSIMKFIQDRYNLRSIGTRDAMQKDFDNVFEVDLRFPGWVIAIVVVCGVVFLLAVGIAIYQGIRYATKKRYAYSNV